MTYLLDTRDGYVRRIIAVGESMGVSSRGCVIAIATMLVETQIKLYANPKVPESMALPHDAVGVDGMSVGLFQQQVRRGNGGSWWWGDAEACMNPETSARMFFERLAQRDYGRGDAGEHAQAVQQSAFPDRYAQRMSEAQALYDRLAGGTRVSKYYDVDMSQQFGFGRPRSTANLVGVCIHTTESGAGASARDVAAYQARSQTGSYNVLVDDRERVLCNTDDWQVWATGNKGNDVLLHLAFVAQASWSRAEWLAHSDMLRMGAGVVRQWCDRYRFPVRKVTVAMLPGILGHVDTQAWGGTDHYDPGPNFPWDEFLQMVKDDSLSGSTDGGFLMALTDKEQRELLNNTRVIRDQLGPKLDAWGAGSSFGQDAQGRELTQRDGLIAKLNAILKAVSK